MGEEGEPRRVPSPAPPLYSPTPCSPHLLITPDALPSWGRPTLPLASAGGGFKIQKPLPQSLPLYGPPYPPGERGAGPQFLQLLRRLGGLQG